MNSPKPLLPKRAWFRLRSFGTKLSLGVSKLWFKSSRVSPPCRYLIVRRFIGFGIGLCLLAGPILCHAQTRSKKERNSQSRGAQSDVLPRANPSPANDLYLRKEGEKMADALAAFSEGLTAEDAGDMERALEAYQRSLSADPSNVDLAVKVAVELARRGEVPQAIGFLKDTEKTAPKESIVPLCISQLYSKFLRKYDLAERYALKAIPLDPESYSPYLALYEIYTATKQPKKGEAILERAPKTTAAADPYFWLSAADILVREEVKQGADITPETLEKVQALFQKTLDSSKGHGDRIEILTKIADSFIILRQVAPALPYYQSVVSESKDPKTQSILLVREKLARCHLALEQKEEGTEVLVSLCADSPYRSDLLELLGQLYLERGKLKEATDAFRKALALDESQPRYFYRIAELEARQNRLQEAAEILMAARKKFRNHPQTTLFLAMTLRDIGKLNESLALFEETVKEAGQRDDTLLDSAFYFNYGTTAEQLGYLERATELLRKSIQLDPANAAQAYNYLGYMWVDKGINLIEAQELIQRALAIDPENGAYLDSLGWCFYKLGRFEEARIYMEKSVERMHPEESVIFDHYGDVLHALKLHAEALAAWKKAAALNPNDKKIAAKIASSESQSAQSIPASDQKPPTP